MSVYIALPLEGILYVDMPFKHLSTFNTFIKIKFTKHRMKHFKVYYTIQWLLVPSQCRKTITSIDSKVYSASQKETLCLFSLPLTPAPAPGNC